MTVLRRFLVVQVLMLWQGGFLFYTAFVVPVGTEVLGSAARQGAITSRVTDGLNLCGVVTLAILAWELTWTRDPSARRTAARWWLWAAALVLQLGLLFLHEVMVAFMDPTRSYVVIRPPFYPAHRIYLWTSTVLWVVCLALTWLTLRAWAAEASQA